MTDLASDFDFAAESNAAEAAALEAEGFAPETVPDVQPAEQPQQIEGQTELAVDDPGEQLEGRRRDPETGQFLPNEDPSLTAEEQQAADDFYVDRYKSKEEGERGIREMRAETQRAQAERDQERREKEQYRQQVEQYEAWVREQQQAVQRQQVQPQVDWTTMLEDDPVGAADLARQHNDQRAYQQALAAIDDSWGPGAHSMYERSWKAEQYAAQAHQASQAQQAAMAETQNSRLWQEAAASFAQTHPAIDDPVFAAEMQSIAEQATPAFRALLNSDPEARLDALDILYTKAQQNLQGHVNAQVQDIARTQATEAQRAREDAFVASSGTQTAQEPVTAEDQEAHRFEERVLQNQTKWQDGWDRPADGSLDERLAKLRGQNDPDRVRRFGLGN